MMFKKILCNVEINQVRNIEAFKETKIPLDNRFKKNTQREAITKDLS